MHSPDRADAVVGRCVWGQEHLCWQLHETNQVRRQRRSVLELGRLGRNGELDQ
jgi:hypothetical protein